MHNSTSTPARSGNPSRHLRRALSGDRNQCPSCGEFFNSTLAFESHRTGAHGAVNSVRNSSGIPRERHGRRCLDAAEMSAKGMAHNAAGFWVSERRTSEGAPGSPAQVGRIDFAAAIS